MQLNDFKPAWEQIKLLSAMEAMDPKEILSLIDGPEETNKTKLQRALLHVGIFIVITIICQGG